MNKKNIRFYYGIVLVLVGMGVFFRIPEVMNQVAEIEFFRHKLSVVRFCFYILGIFLVIAGIVRIKEKPPE